MENNNDNLVGMDRAAEAASSERQGRGHKRKAPEEDPRMQLTDEEHQWALAIKQALQEDDEVLACAICDMEIAAYAIVDHGNIERAVERATCLQAFRMTYNINDNVEEAMSILRRSEEHHPGCMLSIDKCPNDDGKGGHLMVVDMAQFNPQSTLEAGPQGFRILLGGFYYMILSMQSDYGFRQVIECDGVGRHNISLKIESCKYRELLSFFPMLRKEIKVLRLPSVIAFLISFLRPSMEKSMADSYAYGHQALDIEYPERIDHYYLQPTAQRALEASMERIHGMLTRRHENEQVFRL